MNQDKFAHVEACIQAMRSGQMIIMVDDEDRENEGDFVVAAQFCGASEVNFMSREGRGLICLALSSKRIEELKLPMMVPTDPGYMGTAFTVSIEARRGVTTGISAADRAQTIRVASDEHFGANDIVSPGHIFPLRAQEGGVLVRSGHTEGSVDLARLAGLRPAAVICEIMRDDGTMARMDDLEIIAQRHQMPILAIADLIAYRLQRESLIEQIANIPFTSPLFSITADQGWSMVSFCSTVEPRSYFVALCKGDLLRENAKGKGILLRAQRAQVLSDVFGFGSEESSAQIHRAIQLIERSGCGVFLYVMGHRFNNFERFLGLDVRAPIPSSKPAEAGFREFGLGAQVLRQLGVDKIRVITDHPRKIVGLEGFAIETVGTVSFSGESHDT